MTDEEIDEEIELSHNTFPKCPYCKHDNEDDDLRYQEDEEILEINCNSCGKTFEIYVHIDVSFSSSKIVGAEII